MKIPRKTTISNILFHNAYIDLQAGCKHVLDKAKNALICLGFPMKSGYR
jgi:hypothetical protein